MKHEILNKSVTIVTIIFFILTMMLISPFTGITAHAICCRKDGFDKSRYTLTGNMAEDVATIAKSQKGRTGAQLGYTEAWCDEYVADCIENAGGDSSIVGHGGSAADFETVMHNRGAVQVSSPLFPRLNPVKLFKYPWESSAWASSAKCLLLERPSIACLLSSLILNGFLAKATRV